MDKHKKMRKDSQKNLYKDKDKEQQNNNSKDDFSMESIQPLGNISSMGNEDEQSVTNLYEIQKNDLLLDNADHKKKKQKAHQQYSPRHNQDLPKMSSLSPNTEEMLNDKGSSPLKRS